MKIQNFNIENINYDEHYWNYNIVCNNCNENIAEYQMAINNDNSVYLCRRCLLKLKRLIDDVVEKH